MKIHRSTGYIHLDFSSAEASALLEELETVRGGSKLPKIRQICEGLRQSFALNALMAAPKMGRPKTSRVVAINSQRQSPFEIETTAPWLKDENEPSEE